MKYFVLISFALALGRVSATDSYRSFLLLCQLSHPATKPAALREIRPVPLVIPPYQIPKGAVFCRMEDKLTRLTGIWFKVGVH